MNCQKVVSMFVLALFVLGLAVTSPTNGNAQEPLDGCCQYSFDGQASCLEVEQAFFCPKPEVGEFIEFYENQVCTQSGACAAPSAVRAVPTLSEWGMIATAGVLGLIGFIVIRRRKLAA